MYQPRRLEGDITADPVDVWYLQICQYRAVLAREKADASNEAINLIMEAGQYFLEHFDIVTGATISRAILLKLGFNISRKDRSALYKFLERHYWSSRMWLVQKPASQERCAKKPDEEWGEGL